MRVDADGELSNVVCPRARRISSPDEGECNSPCNQRLPFVHHVHPVHPVLKLLTGYFFIAILQFACSPFDSIPNCEAIAWRGEKTREQRNLSHGNKFLPAFDNNQLNVGVVVSSITYYRLSAEVVLVINSL